MKFPEHPFWDFALAVYKSEGVAAACLNLQERHGIDVNVMLFCLWFGHSGRGELSRDEVSALLAATERWHRVVVKGLRLIRRALKEGFPEAPEELRGQLRVQVQATEIDAEHLQQLMLVAAVPREARFAAVPAAERAAHAVANCGAYFREVPAHFEPRDVVDFAHILGKGFAGMKPDQTLDLSESLM